MERHKLVDHVTSTLDGFVLFILQLLVIYGSGSGISSVFCGSFHLGLELGRGRQSRAACLRPGLSKVATGLRVCYGGILPLLKIPSGVQDSAVLCFSQNFPCGICQDNGMLVHVDG